MKYKNLCLIVALFGCAILAGCDEVMKDRDVFGRYYVTTLKVSTSADVLETVAANNKELISQSPNVVASWGQQNNAEKLWFNMVAFEQEKSTAARKYALLVDENAGSYIVTPKRRLRFDAASVVDKDLLTDAFGSENARSIAVLKAVRESFVNDARQVTLDGDDLRSAVMVTQHVFASILTQLDKSPALASRLAQEDGMSFDEINLGKGRIRMLIRDDVATVKVRIGEGIEGFKNEPDVKNM